MKSERTTLFAFLFLAVLCTSSRAQVVFIDTPGQPLPAEERLEHACRFYGLDIAQVAVHNDQAGPAIRNALEHNDGRAIVITGRVLDSVDVNDIRDIVAENPDKKISTLIVGITTDTDPNTLREWSVDCSPSSIGKKSITANGLYKISANKEISHQLAGLEFPIAFEEIHYLIVDGTVCVRNLIRIEVDGEEAGLPILVKTPDDERDVFLHTHVQLSRSSARTAGRFDTEYFLELAPLMIFLRYSCGRLCWHSPGHYANLTIDDPWLAEPYGHLSYKGLLQQMDKAGFHLTIAFIPWNYDRSEEAVVSLFRDRPDRFSICFHGNDHDHYEFYKYQTNAMDPMAAVPLDAQEIAVRQGIARMEQFKNATGLAYDRVMVFPQGIAPSESLGLLKKYNFLATFNGHNVPLGSNELNDPLFSFRPVTLAFENFASLDRDPAHIKSEADIAVDLFLGNSLLFYGHHDLFRRGIDAFNETAKIVNSIEPTMEWRSLDYIARRQYLERIRPDGSHDIRSFCRSIELENKQQRQVLYHIRKAESFSPPVRRVTMDGRPSQFEKSDGDIILTTTVTAGESSVIDILYQNDLDVKSIDIAKNDPRVRRLRRLSDFRDMTLSRSIPGRILTSVYYGTGFYKLGLKRMAVVCSIVIVAMSLGIWRFIRGVGRRRIGNLQIHDRTRQRHGNSEAGTIS